MRSSAAVTVFFVKWVECATSYNVVFTFNSIRIMGAVVWAAVFGVVIFIDVSEVNVSSLNAASSFISNTFVIAPVVFAAFFSISMVAGGVSVISATHAFASFVSIMAALAFISAGILDVTPNFVVVMIVFATVFFALVSV